MQEAINANIAAGRPIGGTSAGLAVLGEFSYGCLKDKDEDNDLASADVLPNPYHERVTLVRDFLKVPYLDKMIPTVTLPNAMVWDERSDFSPAWYRTAGTGIRATLRSTKMGCPGGTRREGYSGWIGEGRLFSERHSSAWDLQAQRSGSDSWIFEPTGRPLARILI